MVIIQFIYTLDYASKGTSIPAPKFLKNDYNAQTWAKFATLPKINFEGSPKSDARSFQMKNQAPGVSCVIGVSNAPTLDIQ